MEIGGNRVEHLRGKCNKELLQIQFRILRECNLYPQRRLEIVDINVECRYRHVVVVAELMVTFRESLSECCTIDVGEERFLLRLIQCANGDVHLGGNATSDGKVCVYVRFDWRVAEVDLCVVTVFLLRQIKRKLVVNSEIVVARILFRIAVIVICGITLFTMIARKSFRAAETFARLWIAVRRLVVTLASLTRAAIDRIPPVASFAFITIRSVDVSITGATV